LNPFLVSYLPEEPLDAHELLILNSSDSRLLEISQEPITAPVTATPVAVEEDEASDPQEEEAPPTPAAVESTVGIGGVPMQSSSSSFHFMQESELEAQTPFEDGAEWVERPDAVGHQAEQQMNMPPSLDLEETQLVNGVVEESLPEVIASIFPIPHRPSSHSVTAPTDRHNRLGSRGGCWPSIYCESAFQIWHIWLRHAHHSRCSRNNT
jgi:hypothetical protein